MREVDRGFAEQAAQLRTVRGRTAQPSEPAEPGTEVRQLRGSAGVGQVNGVGTEVGGQPGGVAHHHQVSMPCRDVPGGPQRRELDVMIQTGFVDSDDVDASGHHRFQELGEIAGLRARVGA
nr:hypothetical protein [Microlunatus sp. Gsoil 973]